MNAKHFRCESQREIAVITFDSLDSKVNLLTSESLDELLSLIVELEQHDTIKSVIIISAKDQNFIAGADIRALSEVDSPLAGETLCKRAQTVFDAIAQSAKTYVAAIHGSCYGGGFELALACHYRIATTDQNTHFAFPEVNFGFIPAAGGTQRLPRLVGLKVALHCLLFGKPIGAQQALQSGLVDSLVSQREGLFERTRDFARMHFGKQPQRAKKLSLFSLVPLWRMKKSMRKKRHSYSAPFAIIDAITTGVLHGIDAGQKREAQLCGELLQTKTSKNLVRLFFAKKSREKNPFADAMPSIKKIGVMGAGLMGTGVTLVSLQNHIDVILNDPIRDALARADHFISRNNTENTLTGKLTLTSEQNHLFECDAVIEAISEDLDAKRNLLRQIEPHLPANSIFASNTSSFPITKIAENSAIKDRIVGMHYFSPVEKMPLLEIIRTPAASKASMAAACSLGIKQKKTLIIVNDSPGFYTTRVMAALFDETVILLLEGHDPMDIDERMQRIGFHVGPVGLMDHVGIDVASHVTKYLSSHFGPRLIAANSNLSEQMVSHGFLGRKTKRGFYDYKKDHRFRVNPSLDDIIISLKKDPIMPAIEEHFEDRLLLRMVNEATFCLSENIVTSEEDGDVGAVYGLGFPAHLGGPFTYIHDKGKTAISAQLDLLTRMHGERFNKSPFLRELVS